MMGVAMVISHRSTCLRRNVGCVLVNGRGHIIAVGYNGVASGEPHCNDGHPCAGFDLPAGQDSCEGIHAETNAILQCQNAWDIDTAYVTLSPCKACLKLLLNTSCRRIVFMHEHDDPWSKAQWTKSRGSDSWVHYDK
jgi:dCMP deaminase